MSYETMKYHGRRLRERSVSEFYGLCLGVLSDGVVNQQEAKFLLDWLDARSKLNRVEPDPLVRIIYSKLKLFLNDDNLDSEEERQLIKLLVEYTGAPMPNDTTERETTSLPLSNGVKIDFNSRLFCFTGIFAFGTRSKCTALVEKLGCSHSKDVVMKLDYLVVGHHATPDWLNQSYGRKIMKAVDYRDNKNKPIGIVSEKQFIDAVRSCLKKRD